jgi:hypothetical protein
VGANHQKLEAGLVKKAELRFGGSINDVDWAALWYQQIQKATTYKQQLDNVIDFIIGVLVDLADTKVWG